jgi:hypothetical protein
VLYAVIETCKINPQIRDPCPRSQGQSRSRQFLFGNSRWLPICIFLGSWHGVFSNQTTTWTWHLNPHVCQLTAPTVANWGVKGSSNPIFNPGDVATSMAAHSVCSSMRLLRCYLHMRSAFAAVIVLPFVSLYQRHYTAHLLPLPPHQSAFPTADIDECVYYGVSAC